MRRRWAILKEDLIFSYYNIAGSTAAAADWQGCGRRAAGGLRVDVSASHWRCGNGEDTQPALGCAAKIRRRWAICTAVGETRHLHVGEGLAQPGPRRRYECLTPLHASDSTHEGLSITRRIYYFQNKTYTFKKQNYNIIYNMNL